MKLQAPRKALMIGKANRQKRTLTDEQKEELKARLSMSKR